MRLVVHPEHPDLLRRHVAERFGLNFDNGLQDRFVEALARGAQRTGCNDADDYAEGCLQGRWPSAEIGALLADLTVPETHFFRHPDQFQAVLERAILNPPSSARPRRLRILSAGCASGEEAYSLAILLRDNPPPGSDWDASVVGIDINPDVLAKAAAACYTPWSLRGVSEEIRRRHFRVRDGQYVLDDSVRRLATFFPCNLVADDSEIWRPNAFDVIFCRNVTMYFTPEATRAVVARLARSLSPGGFLFLGPAETLRGISQDFHLQHTHDTFYYQRRSAEELCGRSSNEFEPCREPAPRPLPFPADFGDSWVETICRASRRVESLSHSLFPAALLATPAEGGCRRPGGAQATASSRRLGAARQLVIEERFGEALEALEALPSSERNNPDAQLMSAAVCTNAGRIEEAERLCLAVLARDELNAEAHYLLALCREHAGDASGAIEQDQMAMYVDPGFALPHLHLALLSKRSGRREQADAAFRKAADLLAKEDTSRIVLLGGGFSRGTLVQLCRNEIRASEAAASSGVER